VVPEFKAWLDSESQLDMPKNLPPAPAAPAKPVKPMGTAPAPALVAMPAPAKPGTAPSPALGGPAKTGTAPAPVLGAAKTATAPALGATGKPIPAPVRPVAPGRPAAPPRPLAEDEVDVELVPDPAALAPAAPQVQIVTVKDERGLTEFDRRDWIMLAAGAASVLAAVGVGYGLARLVRKKPEETPPSEE
jgi:hypothetical protein